MDIDVQYPPNEWFVAASKVAHGLTGDPTDDLQKALRKCLLNSVKDPNGVSETDLPKTHFICTTAKPPFIGNLSIRLQAFYSAEQLGDEPEKQK
jgi:hypothetical protein